ncbi:MAG: hypothetical protein LBR61_04165 [Synergistaceae bacterium]|jgi:hypothetical protein|nr:hypothetical protein [Synergistaceae bacterium]
MKNFSVPLFVLFSAMIFSLRAFVVSPAEGAPLPDALGEWRTEPPVSVRFETASHDLGVWENRTYIRAAPPASIGVDWMEGAGPGTLRVPEGEISRDDAPLGFVSVYKTLDVAGKSAILERGEVTGQVMAVAFGKNRTLTFETKSVSEEELLTFAARLVVELEKNIR